MFTFGHVAAASIAKAIALYRSSILATGDMVQDHLRLSKRAIAGHCLALWPQLEPSFISNVDTDIYNSREV